VVLEIREQRDVHPHTYTDMLIAILCIPRVEAKQLFKLYLNDDRIKPSLTGI